MRSNDEERPVPPVPNLDDLYAERAPPPGLRERVVGDFRAAAPTGESGAPTAPRRGRRPIIVQAAAALAVFALGWGLGSRGAAPGADESTTPEPADTLADGGAPAAGGPRFMLLLWEGDGFEPSDDAAATAAAYAAWAGSVARSGVPISGEELGETRTVVGQEGEGAAGGATRLGGYFIVGTASADEARRLVRGHPHLVRGGAIEIAPIVRR